MIARYPHVDEAGVLHRMLCCVPVLVVGFSPLMFLYPHVDEGGVLHGDNNWVVCMLVVQLAGFLLLICTPSC